MKQQEEVRQRLNEYLLQGVTQAYISRKIGIPTDIICRYRLGKKDLYLSHLNELDDFLKLKGF
jgi:arginine repressor